MYRKAQFFIIGAVIIVITLFSLNNMISQNWMLDLSDVQGEDIVYRLNGIQDNLNYTIQNSGSEHLDNNLKSYIAVETDLMKRLGYKLKINYKIDTDIATNITIKSPNVYVAKNIVFKK